MSAGAAASAPARYRVRPGGRIAGTLTVPGDKSISHRALMLGAIAEGDTHITGFLAGEDCLSTARALGQLGVRIERPRETEVWVRGVGRGGLTASAAPLDMGNAGTAMRLFTGLLAAQKFNSTLVGDASLMRRPMQRVVVPLAMMGAQIRTHDGRPPVEIRATPQLRAIHYSLPVASAQVKSAVLLAGLAAAGRTRVTEPAPSRDHTERMLAAFGVQLEREGRSIALDGGQSLKGTALAVPADFSSAAFFIVAACLAASPSLTLSNVGVNPTRIGLIELLRRMGADIRVHARTRGEAPGGEPVADLEIRQSQLHGITVPEADVPLSIDEFPVLFVAAACATGETLVRGALELRVKESDRLATMAAGLGQLGVEHQLLPDGLWIRGAEALSGGTIDSRGDHRIAMAFAVAALRASAPIEILDVANVATSFPGFTETARAAGLGVEALYGP
ncbi:MAG TPA: 3-phosphoshikimate 1-carboxyvinyltransferase [Steroidobacteraceae bacterium]|nr:3-phosphoshikimate 1-carboxyvinyltransferase [Steroidobacteraceae bacterium]